MRKICFFAMIFIPIACTNSGITNNPVPDVCKLRLSRAVEFTELAVHAYTNPHGSYLTIDLCPSHTVTVDYSRINLYNDQNKDLLKQMHISAYQGGFSIKMIISGSYIGSTSESDRATVYVDKILKYEAKQ